MSQVRSPSIDLKTPETTTKPTPMDVRKSLSGAPLNASDGKLTTRRFLPLLERDNLQRIANETGQSQISENGSPILPKLGTQSQTHVWNEGNGQVQILRVHITTVRSINASALPFDPKVPGSIRKSLKDFAYVGRIQPTMDLTPELFKCCICPELFKCCICDPEIRG